MKKSILLVLLSVFIMVSCGSFSTKMKVENGYPPFYANQTIYFMYEGIDSLPVKANPVGEFTLDHKYKFQNLWGIINPTDNQISSALENNARDNGANLIFIQKDSVSFPIKARFYYISDSDTNSFRKAYHYTSKKK